MTSEAQLQAAIRQAANDRLAVVPRGGGTQDRWGLPLRRADLHLDLTGMAGIVAYEPADLTVTVRAGTRLADLQAVLAERNQWLPLDPPASRLATVGGVVSGGAYGPWRQLYGGPRDLVIGLRAVLADGQAIAMGARVVKNVAGFDLAKVFVGAFGTLGVISECSLRVRPRPAVRVSLEAVFASPDEAWVATGALLGGDLIPAAVALRGGVLLVAFDDAAEPQAAAWRTICAGAAITVVTEEAWEAVRDFPCQSARLAVRANVPTAALPGLSRCLEATGFESVCYPGLGTVWAVGGEGAEFASALACARAAGGHAVAVNCPVGTDPWGQPDGLLDLYRSLKQRFDPQGMFNPGRFVGGI